MGVVKAGLITGVKTASGILNNTSTSTDNSVTFDVACTPITDFDGDPSCAGKVQYQLVRKDSSCGTNQIDIEVQVKSDSSYIQPSMGDFNIRIDYDSTVIKKIGTGGSSLIQQNAYSSQFPAFDTAYQAQNLNGSVEGATAGIFSINGSYASDGLSATPIPTTWKTVSTLRMNVVDRTKPIVMHPHSATEFPVTGNNVVFLRKPIPDGYFDQISPAFEVSNIDLNIGSKDSLCPPLNVTINQAPAQVDPANVGTAAKFTAVFSHVIDTTSFTASDIVLTGTAPGATVTSVTQIAPNNGTTFEINVTTTGVGTVIADIPEATISYISSIFATTEAFPSGITVDSAGNIYTSNGGATNVSKITPAGVSTILGTTGAGNGPITIDSIGNIYTANYFANNVTKITPEGVSTTLGTTGTAPVGITVDSAGNIYTSNLLSNNVSKITPAGVSTILGTTGVSPLGITIDSIGNIYTVNVSSNDVSKITPAGVSTIFGSTGIEPRAITIDSADNIYTTNFRSNTITKITPSGVFTTLGTTGIAPYGITIDSAGNLYTSNLDSKNVSKITPAGVSTILASTGTNLKTPISKLIFDHSLT